MSREKEKQCFVCLRLEATEVLRSAHKVWFGNREVARKIGLQAVAIIKEGYGMKPTFFCGKKYNTLLSGLFYLLGLTFDNPKTQKEIAFDLGTVDVSVRNSVKGWVSTFPDLFPDFAIKEVPSWDSEDSEHRSPRLFFRGTRALRQTGINRLRWKKERS